MVAPDAAEAWARSGAMALTGRPSGPPLQCPPRTVTTLLQLGGDLERLSRLVGRAVALDVLALLGERAALAGFRRGGDRSCGGATRLLPGADGWVAVSLAREDDAELVPAWLEEDGGRGDSWDAVERAVARRPVDALVRRGRMLGLAVARVGEVAPAPPDGALGVRLPLAASRLGACQPRRDLAGVRVVDLSSLWAGPLCAHLLQLAGADVVKVEALSRPDGARRGPAPFFDLLHAGQRAVALDLAGTAGRRALLDLLAWADVVIEASRPRALAQLGADAASLLHDAGPRVWLSITAYGRTGERGLWIGYGDDAAAAGGLVVEDGQGPCFCADAVADPAAGLASAVGVLAALVEGGRWLLDVALAGVAAHLAGPPAPPGQPAFAAAPPRARPVVGRAPRLGEHTAVVLAEVAEHGSRAPC